jgi:gas vesicle protein
MNAARLTRLWQEAAGDPGRMAEALVDEINDPATGLVTRDFLRAELTQVRGEIAQLRGDLTSAIVQLRGETTSAIAQLRGETTSSIAQLRGETTTAIAQLESRLTWRMITLLGVQIALVGIMVTVLVQVLR